MSEVEIKEVQNQIASLEASKENVKGSKCEVYTRVTGYIRPVETFNPGKRSEVAMRTMMKPCACGK